ncbi:MAG: hydrogenase maturation nickel metallochaperone HypA [Ketobacteraceae bacterium]|nr:hydrogenase maturation nickel metallochaperone HypA [Ketobacteraceae bacterium]
MHELSLVENLVEQTRAHARGHAVKSITLVVGVMTCVDPDAMQFCFNACRDSAGLSATELVIERQYAVGWCRDCGNEFAMHQPIQLCQCGSLNIAVTGGNDILLKELELA